MLINQTNIHAYVIGHSLLKLSNSYIRETQTIQETSMLKGTVAFSMYVCEHIVCRHVVCMDERGRASLV